ncbi:polysialyltransferase family glycosyltransferase [Vibrio lentus]|uniref:polysialyltransferase family glycosyltransferase n=1 Tax=Vibrio lentus TaxID=136468 RepID=UPI0010563930|nr:polysialyltransferase family glycosyltransferase [Vibrio lentus]
MSKIKFLIREGAVSKQLLKDLDYDVLPMPDMQDSFLKKVVCFFRLVIISIKYRNLYSEAYITSDKNIFILLFLSLAKVRNYIYIEEGGTILYLSSDEVFWKYLLKKVICLMVLQNYPRKFLTHPRISIAYVLFPDFVRKHRPLIKIEDIGKTLLNVKANEVFSINNDGLVSCDVVYLTQPLTQDGYCDNHEEVLCFERFLQDNRNLKFLIKLHPRDNISRFESLLNKFENVKILDERYDLIPYQVIHIKLDPKVIVSHTSSVLFTTYSENSDFRRVSLISNLTGENMSKFKSNLSKLPVEVEIL